MRVIPERVTAAQDITNRNLFGWGWYEDDNAVVIPKGTTLSVMDRFTEHTLRVYIPESIGSWGVLAMFDDWFEPFGPAKSEEISDE